MNARLAEILPSFRRTPESRRGAGEWIPACANMTTFNVAGDTMSNFTVTAHSLSVRLWLRRHNLEACADVRTTCNLALCFCQTAIAQSWISENCATIALIRIILGEVARLGFFDLPWE